MSYIESLRKFADGRNGDRELFVGVIDGVEEISKTGFAPNQPDFCRKLVEEIARGDTRGREKRRLIEAVERTCKNARANQRNREQNWQRIVAAAGRMAKHAH